METLENKTKEYYFEKIKKLIYDYGQRFDKKYGNWIKLQYTNDSFFEMDSWNKSIVLKQGSGKYNYWIGFEGEHMEYLGSIDWGGSEVHSNCELLEFYYNNLIKDYHDK
jgi:hypothetical protein